MMNTEKTIRDIMTTNLKVVGEDDTFAKVKVLFDENDFHHLLVVNEEKQLLGIISREDLWRAAYRISFATNEQDNWHGDYLVKDLMTKNPTTIDPDDTLGLAADIFQANKFRALPVVEGNDLVGVVTPYDLLKYAFRDVSISE